MCCLQLVSGHELVSNGPAHHSRRAYLNENAIKEIRPENLHLAGRLMQDEMIWIVKTWNNQ